MIRKAFVSCVIFALLPILECAADIGVYSGSVDIEVEGRFVVARHFHGIEMIDPFAEPGEGPKNFVLSKKDGEVVFAQSVGAYSSIILDEERELVALLSHIKDNQDYQILIFDFSGNIRAGYNLVSKAFSMRQDELRQFKIDYPQVGEALEKRERYDEFGEFYMTSYSYQSFMYEVSKIEGIDDKGFETYIKKFWIPEGFDRRFYQETTTNFIRWHRAENPKGEFFERDGEVFLRVYIFPPSDDGESSDSYHEFIVPPEAIPFDIWEVNLP